MLREILQKGLSELTLEIAFSDRKDFRDFLKKRKGFMEGLIQRLQGEQALGKKEAVSIDRLRKVDILQGLEDRELQSIAQFFETENIASGVTLCEEGAKAERLFVLEQGRVSIGSQRGGQFDIDTPGKVVGWSFLVPPFLYTATVVTKGPSRVLVIKSPDFYYIIHKEPKMGMKVIINLAQLIASRLKGQEG